MGKGIILRVPQGTKLPSVVEAALKTLLPNYELEYYSEKPNYKESIQTRINSLYDAFEFLVEAYPPSSSNSNITTTTLKNYVKTCKQECNLNKTSLKELHAELEKFTARLVEAVMAGWQGLKSKDMHDAVEALNDAEQYRIMTRGRKDIASLSLMYFDTEEEYMLQWDESLSPMSASFAQELKLIAELGYPTALSWYQTAPDYVQGYFRCLKSEDLVQPQEVLNDFSQFRKNWVSSTAAESLKIKDDLYRIHKEIKPYPKWYTDLSSHNKELTRILSAWPSEFSKNLDAFEKFLTEKIKRNDFKNNYKLIAKLPEWYLALSHRQQCFFKHALKDCTDPVATITYLSSRHRTIPLTANFGRHKFYRVSNKGEFTLLGQERYRFSHIASRDVLTCSKALQMRHVTANFSKIAEYAKDGQSILLQTLISPIYDPSYAPQFLNDMVSEKLPDSELFALAREAVAQLNDSRTVFQTNHPYNVIKYLLATQPNNEDALKLLSAAKKFLETNPDANLKELADNYAGVLNSPMGSGTVLDYEGRELFLSSLEQLLVMHMGILATGSCVSGKDRKAVEIMHTNGMLLYKAKYNTWPKFGIPSEREERKRFVACVRIVYNQRHHHILAGQNAPGSDGIKNVDKYFPTDIIEAINDSYKSLNIENAIDNDDRIATDNEVGNISKKLPLLAANEMISLLMANQFGEENCTKLYNALYLLLNEKAQFKLQNSDKSLLSKGIGLFHKNEPSISAGIKEISNVINASNTGNNNIQRMTLIFAIILGRAESDNSRSNATNSVYTKVRELFACSSDLPPLNDRVTVAVSEWNALFKHVMDSKDASSVYAYSKK